MSSNLYKACYTVKETSAPRVIDGNSLVEEAVERLKYIFEDTKSMPTLDYEADDFGEQPEEFMDGLNAEQVDALLGDDSEEGPKSNVIKAGVSSDEIKSDVMHEMDELRRQLMEEAEADVAIMKNTAALDIERDKAMAMEMAKSEGYQQGMEAAEREINAMRAELEQERRRLEEEYEDRIYQLEPQFVRHITNIYERVFGVDLSGHKEMVVNILRNAIGQIEGSKNYVIHVSKDDYDLVIAQRDDIASAAGNSDAVIDIIEDITMKQGDCMIETASGIYDCGIDTQLAAIKKRLTLLSYDGREE